jgi:glycosyltransferase involved in cell wall biosynthesis
MKLTVVIPVFNEARTVAGVIRRVAAEPVDGLEKEIIAVDDGSSDGTREALDALLAEVPGLVVHHFPRNRGKGAAVREGFARASGDLVVVQDADLELDPAMFTRLVRPILAGRARVVFGSRFRRARGPAFTLGRFANFVLSMATSLLYGQRVTDMETCYKTFDRRVLARLDLRAERFDIEPEITAKLLRGGFRIHEVPVTYRPRSRAEGKKIRWTDGVEAMRALLRLRFAPAGEGSRTRFA